MTSFTITFLMALTFPKDEETFQTLSNIQHTKESPIPECDNSIPMRTSAFELTPCPSAAKQMCGLVYSYLKFKSMVSLVLWGSVAKVKYI